MTAGHGFASAFADGVPSLEFVGGVPYAELRCDGVCLDRGIDAVEGSREPVVVEGVSLVAVSAVTTTDHDDRRRSEAVGQPITADLGGRGVCSCARQIADADMQSDAGQSLRFESDGHQPRRSPGPLDECVGCQCGGNRH